MCPQVRDAGVMLVPRFPSEREKLSVSVCVMPFLRSKANKS